MTAPATTKNDNYYGMGESAYTVPSEDTKTIVVPKNQPPSVRGGDMAAGIMSMLSPPPKNRDLSALDREAKRIGHQFGGTQDAQGKSRALYSFPAGGGNIEGATVWLIEALLQSYGHCAVEMHTDEDARDPNRVTITTTVVDFVNSVIYRRPHVASLAPAPAKFANKADQIERWRSMQMQSAVSKAGRTAIQHALPAWYVDTAILAAREAMSSRLLTDRNGKRITFKQAIESATAWYQDEQNVSLADLEAFLEMDRPSWTLSELAYLRETSARINRGEASVAELFYSDQEKVPEPNVVSGNQEVLVPSGLDSLKPAGPATPAPGAGQAKSEPARPAGDAKAPPAGDAKAPVAPAKADAKKDSGGLI